MKNGLTDDEINAIGNFNDSVSKLNIADVRVRLCSECGCENYTEGYDICHDCLESDSQRYDDYYHDNEPDYSDFDCTCGAWQWSEKQGKPIHIADCCCGSSEPWW